MMRNGDFLTGEVQVELPKLDHLFRMCDDTGIVQHALYSVPDRTEGYALDDVVRALQFCCRLYRRSETGGGRPIDTGYRNERPRIEEIISSSLAFCSHAFNRSEGRFRNFMRFDRSWCEEVGSDDAHGRALLGLASALVDAPDAGSRHLASELFERGLPAMELIESPRSLAFAILACGELNDAGIERFDHVGSVSEMTGRLLPRFERRAAESWPWPEPRLTYANARLPHALIVGGEILNDSSAVERGVAMLRWLFNIQKSDQGLLSVIGNHGWYGADGKRATFDQQPIEAACLIEAACCAWRVTGEDEFLEDAGLAWRWFLGENDREVPLYDPETGGCRDGLMAEGVNLNQGAESLLAWLGGSLTLRQTLTAARRFPAEIANGEER